jgi:lipopolysaccharide/colanic/teichoic acid biosynthesis glycosyltransferase
MLEWWGDFWNMRDKLQMAMLSKEAIYLHKIAVRTGEIGKRIFDVFLSMFLLLLLSPIFAIIAIYIKQSSPGPVFYRGPRIGRRGKLFHILKFRTMYESPESYIGPRITASDDKRITSSGRWLRNTKLNELPQLWNVLKGEMSVVGPRPEDPEVVVTWSEKVRQEILSVRPGITSPASVLFRQEENMLKAESVMEKYLDIVVPSKLRLDQIYARNHSFVSDLDILFLTAIFLLPNLREQPVPEHLLLWGPLSRLFSRHLNWLILDIPVAFLAVTLAGILWRSIAPLNLGLGSALLLAIGIALLFGILNAILGMNRIAWSQARSFDAWGLAISIGIVTGFLKAVQIIWPSNFHFPDGMLILTSLFAFFGFLVTRYRFRLLTGLATLWLHWRGGATHLGERILIIGAGEMARITIHLLRQNGFVKSYSIIGMIDDDPKLQGLSIDGCKILGTTQDLPHLVKDLNVGEILFSIGKIQPDRRQDILDLCYQSGMRLVLIPNILELLSACLFTPERMYNKDIVSPDWAGAVPVQVIMGWLTELESLAQPGNKPLISRVRQLRDALAADILGENS